METPASTPGTAPRRRLPFAFRVLLLLVGVLVVGACVTVIGWRMYRMWHHALYPHLATYEILHAKIRNGDSKGKVQQLLGPGEANADCSWAINQVISCPDGYHDQDMFLVYEVKGPDSSVTVAMQFRGGRLVNHDPAAYAQWPSSAKLWSRP